MSASRIATMTSVRKLKPNKRNARTHSKKQILQIAESIRRFGWTHGILTDEDGKVIAGHGRLRAAEILGHREVPVVVLNGLSEAEKRALALADNKIAANAGWDRKILSAELDELAQLLPEHDLTVDITGFEPAEIDVLMGDLVDPEHDPADDISIKGGPAVSRPGDVWLLGDHHLCCGDAKNERDVRKLMDGERADMVFADPPYNIPIKSVQGRGRIRHCNFLEGAGELSPAAFTRFLVDSLGLAAKYSLPSSIIMSAWTGAIWQKSWPPARPFMPN
jgi:hypothetical protein